MVSNHLNLNNFKLNKKVLNVINDRISKNNISKMNYINLFKYYYYFHDHRYR